MPNVLIGLIMYADSEGYAKHLAEGTLKFLTDNSKEILSVRRTDDDGAVLFMKKALRYGKAEFLEDLAKTRALLNNHDDEWIYQSRNSREELKVHRLQLGVYLYTDDGDAVYTSCQLEKMLSEARASKQMARIGVIPYLVVCDACY